MNLSLVGIDLAKSVFYVVGQSRTGEVVFSQKLSRKNVGAFFANLPVCTVAMEACGGCFYWARLFRSQGHEVKIMPAQFVKAFLQSGKNDRNDALAICEAAQRPTMKTVAVKPLEQQDAELKLQYRRRLVGNRTRLVNEMRSLLHEYGVVLPVSLRRFSTNIVEVIEGGANELTDKAREILRMYLSEYQSLSERLAALSKSLESEFKASGTGRRLAGVPGIGPISGSAFVALEHQARQFRNGRTFAAWLGLVPSQYSSGGKEVLGRISKRGNAYLRTLLIHGARAVLSKAKLKPEKSLGDPRITWALELAKRKGMNKASVAYANKNARVLWHLLTKPEETYRYAVNR